MIEGAAPVAQAAGVAAGVTAVAVTSSGSIVLGIPAAVLLASCAGALFGLAYTKPELWARLMAIPAGSKGYRLAWVVVRASGLMFTLVSSAVACGWFVSAAPHVPMLGWTGEIPPVPLAGLLGYGAQRLIPAALNRATRKVDGEAA